MKNNIVNIVSIAAIATSFLFLGMTTLAPQESQATICPMDIFKEHAEGIKAALEEGDIEEAKTQTDLILELTQKAEDEE